MEPILLTLPMKHKQHILKLRNTCNIIASSRFANISWFQTRKTHPAFFNYFPLIQRTKAENFSTGTNLMFMVSQRARELQSRRGVSRFGNRSWHSMDCSLCLTAITITFLLQYFVLWFGHLFYCSILHFFWDRVRSQALSRVSFNDTPPLEAVESFNSHRILEVQTCNCHFSNPEFILRHRKHSYQAA